MDMSNGKRTAIVAALFAVLSACGGGGSSTQSTGTSSTGGSSTTTATTTTTTTTTATTTPPALTGAMPQAGTVGAAYTYTFTATGSTPITYAVTSGTLPTGLTLSASGTISGTPTVAGTYSVTTTASNGTSPNALEIFSIVIAPAPSATAFCTFPLNTTSSSGSVPSGVTMSFSKVDATHFDVNVQVLSSTAQTFMLDSGGMVFVQNGTTGQVDAVVTNGTSSDFTYSFAQYGAEETVGAGVTQTIAEMQVPSWFQSGSFTVQYAALALYTGAPSPVTCTW